MRWLVCVVLLLASTVFAQNPRPRADIGPEASTSYLLASNSNVVNGIGVCLPIYGGSYSVGLGSSGVINDYIIRVYNGSSCAGAAIQSPLDYAIVSGLWAYTGSVSVAGTATLGNGCFTSGSSVNTVSCALTYATNINQTMGANGSILLGSGTGAIDIGNASAGFKLAGKVVMNGTTPTISSGFGTSPSVSAGTSTAAFRVNVGTGGTASAGVIALNTTATTGWNCFCTDITSIASSVYFCKQTASTTTTASFTNYSNTGVASPWAASDILAISCFGY
jgi:hypothetical protein